MLFLWLHPLHWAVERLAAAVCGEGDRRENGRKAEYVGLVVLHLFLTPLCRLEIFLNKNFKAIYMRQNSNTTVKSLLPIPSSFLLLPSRPASPSWLDAAGSGPARGRKDLGILAEASVTLAEPAAPSQREPGAWLGGCPAFHFPGDACCRWPCCCDPLPHRDQTYFVS